MSTFITRMPTTGAGLRLAVKDLIDMAGLPTTAGSRAVADEAQPAAADALCMAGTRAAEAAGEVRIVGKANLHELAFGPSGINEAFGTPMNPVDASRIPGGSSSGSAVAVAGDESDVAFGSDTGGSVRVPSECCGTAGLKTTYGRIPLDGVWPLASSLDTVGPMARDVAGLVAGMRLLEPGFEPVGPASATIGRLREIGDVDPEIDRAVDRALALFGGETVNIDLPNWGDAFVAGGTILLNEATAADGHLLDRRDRLGADVAARIELGRGIPPEAVGDAEQVRENWREVLDRAFSRVEVLALPTLQTFPPTPAEVDDVRLTFLTMPMNLAGLPALVLPVPAGRLPASIQLVGPRHSEERLLAVGAALEHAIAAG